MEGGGTMPTGVHRRKEEGLMEEKTMGAGRVRECYNFEPKRGTRNLMTDSISRALDDPARRKREVGKRKTEPLTSF